MSITISRSAGPSAAVPHESTTPPQVSRDGRLRANRPPSTMQDSFALIGALKRSISRDSVREPRRSRGERYAALTHYALNRASPRLAEEFALRLEHNLRVTRGNNFGGRCIKATDTTVRDLVKEGLLSKESAREIRSEALGDKESRTTGPERSRQLSSVDRSAPLTPSNKGPTMSLSAPSGFLWKPISDSDGLLAVLLPIEWTGDATKVEILSPDGQRVLAEGRPAGVGNGGREHFRFDRSGSAFPAGAIVRVHRGDGSVNEIVITQPAMRGEGVGRAAPR